MAAAVSGTALSSLGLVTLSGLDTIVSLPSEPGLLELRWPLLCKLINSSLGGIRRKEAMAVVVK